MNYKSIADLTQDIKCFIPSLPQNIDLIIGIPRDGMLVASIMSLWLDIAFIDVDGFCNKKLFGTGRTHNDNFVFEQCKKALVIDDAIRTGETMKKAKMAIAKVNPQIEIKYAVIYVTPKGNRDIDYWYQSIPAPRLYEWNMSSHHCTVNFCYDIDGVLCVNPPFADDKPEYIDYLKKAKVLFKPSVEIGWIITGRKEIYRRITEGWLTQNGIRYKNLIMRPAGQKDVAAFKAGIYRNTKSTLFIESSLRQSQRIAEISHKDVLCMRTNQIVKVNGIHNNYFKARGLKKR